MNLPQRALFALTLVVTPMSAALTPEQAIKTMPEAEVEKMLPKDHPSSYYLYAGRLFGEGKKDDAVFWFYVGELRYRFYLKANPNPERSGDLALFGSLHAALGTEIDAYSGGNVKDWVKAMDRALKWDADTDNGYTSKKKFAADHKEIRAGLKALRDQVAGEADLIREERKKAGLETRG